MGHWARRKEKHLAEGSFEAMVESESGGEFDLSERSEMESEDGTSNYALEPTATAPVARVRLGPQSASVAVLAGLSGGCGSA